ncbi:unnamed protein product [Spirodela intermedia]|uniref:Uncharacterized protein n=1 Tax=Spirodela intermedia TaxID=51605 RepID=A0A7I8KSX1_SPIIN|nr:unnamed protein product [Spirodela intermedia]
MGSCLSSRKATAPLPLPMGKLSNGPGHAAEGNGEIFFDSRAWLDSDCEDDFFSINGDFTPSQGSTPNHQLGSAMKPKLEGSLGFDGLSDTQSEPSPRKKLAEFLHETKHVKLEPEREKPKEKSQ